MYDLTMYNKAKALIKKDLMLVKGYLKDHTRSLADRWETFKTIENDLPIDGCYFDLPYINGEEITYYDDLYCDRYQTMTFTAMIDALCDKWSVKEDNPMFDEVKNLMLSSGYGACINDW